MERRTLLILACIAVGFVGSALAVEYAPTVQLAGGKVRGTVKDVEDHGKVHWYQGIRYGRAARFSKPKPVEPWTGVYNATHYRFACPQQSVPFSETVKQQTTLKTVVANEDCLFLNVWKPAEEKANRSVMVWIHGGGFTEGTIFSVYYDGRYISSMGDVIVVTVNYRLDAFGFMFGGTEDAPGNQGLYDQLLALKWVKENIAQFGGNPNSVTLFGESAGSFSTSALVLSPLSKGLFQRAIMQSGATNSWLGSRDQPAALDNTQSLASKLNCKDASMTKMLACMRSKTVNEILHATGHALADGESYIPVYGGELMPVPPVQALKTGKFNHDIDLLYGVTKNEGSMFVVEIFNHPMLDPEGKGVITVNSTRTFISFMMSIFRDKNPAEVAEYYTKNLKDDTEQDEMRRAISYAFGDYHLVCPTVLYGETMAKLVPKNKFYSYRLMKRTTTPVMLCRGWMGICHGEDVVFVFGLPLHLQGIAFTDDEVKLAKDMIYAWTRFAKTGNPEKMGNVKWDEAVNRADLNGPARMIEMGDSYRMVDGVYKKVCDQFWKPRIFA